MFESYIAGAIFLIVTFFIITDLLHLTVISLLGAILLVVLNVITLPEAINYIGESHGTIALFFGVMVLIRAFEPTKFFSYLATQVIILAKGKGSYLLLGIVAVTSLISSIFPNATTVLLLAPLITPLATDLGIDFIPLLILIVFTANSAGILTLVGDPATFIVGNAINITFNEYLIKLSFCGIWAIITLVLITPYLFAEIWNLRFTNFKELPKPKIEHPRMLIIGAIITGFVLLVFVIGDSLPVKISPATVALMGAALALLLSHHSHISKVHDILRDLDWSTLIFFMSTFVLIGSLEKTGIISALSKSLSSVLGQNILVGVLVLNFLVGLLSSVVPNIPLLVAMVPLVKEYVVNTGLASKEILNPHFAGQLPPQVLVLFYAIMFGATLGGNGTLVGASSNIVAAGIAEQHGQVISFKLFLKYGIPVMIMQLIVSALYILIWFPIK